MAESLVSKASRIIRVGNDLSGTNQKLKDAVHAFLLWFCPLVAGERNMPSAGWSVSHYGNQAWGLKFGYDREEYEVRSDGHDCRIKDYQTFCLVLADSEERLLAWMTGLIQQRRKFVTLLENIPASADYKPAKLGSNEPISVGQTDVPLVVFRSHPDFPNTLAPEIEGAWSCTNPAWPDASVDWILDRLDSPCRTNWQEFDQARTEERDGLKASVVYVKPGVRKGRPVNI